MMNLRRIFGLMLFVAGLAGVAHATQPITPEIDPGTAGSALTLITGSLFMLKDRRRGK